MLTVSSESDNRLVNERDGEHHKAVVSDRCRRDWGTLETPQTIPNNHTSHRFISLLSDINPFTLALSHNYVDDA